MNSALELAFLLSDYLVVLVSLVIAYVAYRGYTRNDSRPMLFVAVGFLVAFGGPGGIFVVSQVTPLSPVVTATVTQLTETVGMLTILYGFYLPARQ